MISNFWSLDYNNFFLNYQSFQMKLEHKIKSKIAQLIIALS